MVSFQLQRILPDDYPSQAVSRLSTWSFSIVFDQKLAILVPVYKHPGKPYECQSCRGISTRRGNFQHERCCINTGNKIMEMNPAEFADVPFLNSNLPDGDEESEPVDEAMAMLQNCSYCLHYIAILSLKGPNYYHLELSNDLQVVL